MSLAADMITMQRKEHEIKQTITNVRKKHTVATSLQTKTLKTSDVYPPLLCSATEISTKYKYLISV